MTIRKLKSKTVRAFNFSKFQTFTGVEYLKIDIANNFGLDKLDWQDRLSWFHKNEHQLDALLNQAKEPALFYASIKAYRDVQAGKPIGYMISLDATSSGLQLLAALTCDRRAAALCNVIDTGHREDAYTNIFQMMQKVIPQTATICRDDVKDAIMTAFYNSTAVPKRVFGEGVLLQVFYETLRREAPTAWALNEAMLTLWNPRGYSHDWVLPDNYHVHVDVITPMKESIQFMGDNIDVYYNVNAPQLKGRSLGANMIHSIDGMIVRELTRRCDYDLGSIMKLRNVINRPSLWENNTLTNDDHMVLVLWDHYKKTGYLSARILDHLKAENMGHVNANDITVLIDSLPVKPFKVVSIHDCFRCLPHYGDYLRIQYNYQLMLIAKSTMLNSILSQITGKPITVPKQDPGLYVDILTTNYALS